ncbi:MAG TPA: DNA internalization-related competence protein ComEC/Rec2, partial [Myxococcaceae bacterium]|nr:DNA internalization-related competence protein ComEC/Rec2 [Myxococcaceae bacterium]
VFFFGVGVWLEVKQPRTAPLFLIAAVLLAFFSLRRGARTGAHIAILLAFGCAGIGLSALAAQTELPTATLAPGDATLEGEVEDLRDFGEYQQLTLSVARVIRPEPAPARFRVRLYPRGRIGELFPGQRVRVATRLHAVEPPLNPGQPDNRSRLLRSGTLYSGWFEPEGLVALSRPTPLARSIEDARQSLAALVRRHAPSPEAASLYLTLAAGLRAELSDELEERFSASGLAHILSVSGLHVAVLAVVLLRGLRWFLVRAWRGARRFDVRRAAAPLAAPILWAYVLFTGNQMPAVRSALMASAVLLGMALWRRADPLNGLALAGLAVLAIDPAAIADLSTQLSFLAVASLVVVAPAIRDALPIRRPEPHGLDRWSYLRAHLRESALSTLCASAAVTLATAPLIAEAFGRISLAGLLSNVVCLPLCGVLAVLAAAGAAAFVVAAPLAVPIVLVGTWGAMVLLWAVELFASLPGASIAVPYVPVVCGAMVVIGVFGAAIAQGRWRLLGVLAPMGVAAVAWAPWLAREPGLSVTFLSVGHGDAIVVSSRGQHALIDGGGNVRGVDPGRRVVLPFLRAARIDALELAVLSHPHPDHALGLASVLERVPARRLWLPAGDPPGELARKVISAARGAELSWVEAGHPPLRLGEAELEVLGPPVDRLLLEGVNDRSAVIRLRHGEVSILLPGDAEAAEEEQLDPGAVTVMKVPHHGSRTSSTAAFLARTRPRVAVFCVGRDNRFGFPHPEVESRYRAVGAQCYRTDLHGAVRVDSDGRTVLVRTFVASPAWPDLDQLAATAADRHSSSE